MSKVRLYVSAAAVSALCALGAAWLLRDKANGPRAPVPSQDGALQPQNEAVFVRGTAKAIGPGKDLARQIGTVYVILRDEAGGPPYAVARLSNPGLDRVDFALTPEHVMISGRPFPDRPMLKVRFDADGNASTENPGDVVGQATGIKQGDLALQIQAELLTGSANPN